ncbi:MAG: galactose-1-phosphate uridylyltransferase [Candidatus Falkowbacteria bacterium]
MKKAEIRKSYIFDKYAIIAPGREARPRDNKKNKTVSSCPFCKNNLKDRKILKTILTNNNSVVSVKNEFPAVSTNNTKSYGEQEVIIESQKHSEQMANMDLEQIVAILKMYISRSKTISKNKKIKYISCFKNQGAAAGASLIHPHSQIFATSIITPEVKEELESLKKYFKHNKRCAYCDIIKEESVSKRLVFSDKNMVAFTPYASEYPYELWIFSARHVSSITELTTSEIKSLALILKLVCKKLRKLKLDFNYFLHDVIGDGKQHFYIKIEPRSSVWAGIELGSGIVIDQIEPEEAAKYYRKK